MLGDPFRGDIFYFPISVGTGVAGTHGYYAVTPSAS